MIKLEDLEEAIAECQGEREPNAQTCIKLAAFYTIKEHMFGVAERKPDAYSGQRYSYDSPDLHWQEFENEEFDYQSDTEFAQLASKTDKNVLMRVIDELMTVLEATNPRLYNAVLRKMQDGA